MDTIELIRRLSVALAIGLIIGVERGWKQRSEPEGERTAGLRTLSLAGLLGGVWGALTLNVGAGGLIGLGIAFAAFTTVIASFRYREMQHEGSFGATTVVAGMVAFALGALAVMGDPKVAAAAAVAATILLALKSVLHAWLARLTWEELRSGLVLAAMTLILLPLLPDRQLSPWFPVNPREVWLFTIVIAALSFAGYVVIRVAGARLGILLSGLVGGLVSSTAVTLNMAQLSRQHPTHIRAVCGRHFAGRRDDDGAGSRDRRRGKSYAVTALDDAATFRCAGPGRHRCIGYDTGAKRARS